MEDNSRDTEITLRSMNAAAIGEVNALRAQYGDGVRPAWVGAEIAAYMARVYRNNMELAAIAAAKKDGDDE